MVYPHKWSPISYRSSAGQRKHAGQRPKLYRWTTQPTVGLELTLGQGERKFWWSTGCMQVVGSTF